MDYVSEMKNEVSDSELKKVIADFLEMGHVENIVSMFKRENRYYQWSGELLQDERFNVRLGMAILFEELKTTMPDMTHLAIPALQPLLNHESPLIRGEAIGILGIINTDGAVKLIKTLENDPSEQVREMVEMTLEETRETT